MRAYAVAMVTSLYHQKNGCSFLFSVRKADQEYLREHREGGIFTRSLFHFSLAFFVRPH